MKIAIAAAAALFLVGCHHESQFPKPARPSEPVDVRTGVKNPAAICPKDAQGVEHCPAVPVG